MRKTWHGADEATWSSPAWQARQRQARVRRLRAGYESDLFWQRMNGAIMAWIVLCLVMAVVGYAVRP